MIWNILVIIGLIACSAFFAAAETALTAASRPKMHGLEGEGNRRAGVVNRLRLHMEQVIGTLLLGNNLVNIMSSALATGVLIEIFGARGVVYATGVMTVLIVVFGEVMPKTYAINNADRLALSVAPAMQALVGHLVQPGPGWTVGFFEKGEGGTALQEIFLGIAEGPFNLPFLPGGSHLTDFRDKPQLTGKVQEEQIEAHQGAIPLTDHSPQVVKQDFSGHPVELLKGMQVTTAQGSQSHRVGEFQVKPAAVRFDQGKGIEPPSGTAIIDLTAIGPVHLELLPGRELDADKGLSLTAGPDLVQIGVENAVTSRVAQGTQPVQDTLPAQLGILGQPLLNQAAEGVQLAFPLPFFSLDHGPQGLLPDGLAVQAEMMGHLAGAPLFDLRKLVDGMDLFRG